MALSHSGLVATYVAMHLGQYWFRQWLAACSVPSHHLKQCWYIVNEPFMKNFNEMWLKIQISLQKAYLTAKVVQTTKWQCYTFLPARPVCLHRPSTDLNNKEQVMSPADTDWLMLYWKFLSKQKDIFVFSIICEHWDSRSSSNLA